MQLAASIIVGQIGTINGTAKAMTTDSSPLNTGVRVKALAANATDKVYIGLVGVTAATGYELVASAEVLIPCRDASTLYVVGSGTTSAVSFIGS
jgi:hypothetical protein